MPEETTAVKAYAKVYPTLIKHIHYNQPYNPTAKKDRPFAFGSSPPVSSPNPEAILLDSLRRAKTQISDIVLSNDFDMWCTFTFNGKKENEGRRLGIRATIDRKNPAICKARMSRWLNKQREKWGHFDYLIVPEFHKDGALHFHAFFKGYKGRVSYTGKTAHGKPVYRIDSYMYGIANMQMIGQTPGQRARLGAYIKKYITKDMPLFSGSKRYWCSKHLIRPETIKNPSTALLEAYSYDLIHKLDFLTIRIGYRNITEGNNLT